MAYFARAADTFSFDLKSGYYHVEIFEGHQTYLGFSWKHSNSSQMEFYVLTVLPFGLSSAPHVFTKILKPLEKHWRHQAFALLFLLTTDGVLKWILKCAVLSQMLLELTFQRRVSLLMRISQCGYLARGLIGWVSLKIALV